MCADNNKANTPDGGRPSGGIFALKVLKSLVGALKAGNSDIYPRGSLGFAFALAILKWATEVVRLDYGSLSGLLTVADLRFDLLMFVPAIVICGELGYRFGAVPRWIMFLGVSFIAWVVIVADVLTLQYFRESVLVVVPQLVRSGTASAVTGNQFVFLSPVFGAVSLIAALGIGWRWGSINVQRFSSLRVCGSILAVFGFLWSEAHDSIFQASLSAIADNSIYYHDDEADGLGLPVKPLRSGEHSDPDLEPAVVLAPKTIVLFINESLPWVFPSSSNPGRALIYTLLGQGGLPNSEWFVFPHAFTNSSATDISVPSLLTGVDPTTGTDELQRMPLVYSIAKSRGYRTAFFTSQDYTWFGLRTFFTSRHLDTFVSGDMTGQPTANLMGIDDSYIADKIFDYITSQPLGQPLFLVINNNALHVPYQTKSQTAVPDLSGDSKRKAAYILEHVYGRVFQALRQSGRLEGTLFVVTSDHGESHPNRPRKNARLDSHFDEVINIPFAVRLPFGALPEMKTQLRQNVDRTVENLDIAPTLAWLLGARAPVGSSYAGLSLFTKLPRNRVSVSVTNNEWKQWTPKAFGLAGGNDRLVYSDRIGMQYFDVSRDPDESRAITAGPAYDLYVSLVMKHPTLRAYLDHEWAR